MKQRGGDGLAAFLTSCLVVGLVTGAAPVSADTDTVTLIDPATGKVLAAPGDSELAGDATAGPPNPKPPPYTLLRYTENYSYLANPPDRTDFFDPVKSLQTFSFEIGKEYELSLSFNRRQFEGFVLTHCQIPLSAEGTALYGTPLLHLLCSPHDALNHVPEDEGMEGQHRVPVEFSQHAARHVIGRLG